MYKNGRDGIFLTGECDRATVKKNTVYENLDTGLTLYESSDNVINRNKIFDNICERSCE